MDNLLTVTTMPRAALYDARATGQRCGDCGRALAPGEMRATSHAPHLGRYVICVPCSGWTEAQHADQWAEGMLPECCGCDCPLGGGEVLNVHDGRGDSFTVCSERCRQRVYKRVRRGGSVWTGGQTCEHCGASTASMRSGARFCSGRCRVAAHRAER